jgi:hypothetical protein
LNFTLLLHPKTALPDRSATLKLARLRGQPEIFHSIQGEGKSVFA